MLAYSRNIYDLLGVMGSSPGVEVLSTLMIGLKSKKGKNRSIVSMSS